MSPIGWRATTFDLAAINATAEAAVSRAVLGAARSPAGTAMADGWHGADFAFDGIPDEDFGSGRARPHRSESCRRRIAVRPSAIGGARSAGGICFGRTRSSIGATRARRRRVNGAKDQAYRLAGTSYRPRNGPFQSVDELLLVMDMTPALFTRIAPALTVYSGRQFIDPQVAPREALLALRNMDPARRTRCCRSARASKAPALSPAPSRCCRCAAVHFRSGRNSTSLRAAMCTKRWFG